MLKRFILYFFLFITVFSASAQDDVQFTMSAPNAVAVGQQFRLTLSINKQGNKIHLPDLSNFDLLMGPSTSTQQSFQSINGRTSRSTTYSYTYILRAKAEGTFEIRPASIEVDRKVVESNSLRIQVVKGNANAQSQQRQQSSSGNASGNISKDDLFVRVILSKRNVYRGEQIIATVKLYTTPGLPLSGFEEINLPSYEGFYTQDIDIPQQINLQREVYNDKIYQSGILKKTILFPQQNGTITIKPFDISCLVRQQVRARSFFDDFFDNARTVKTTVTSPAVTVNVKDLPAAPANFYGGVGNFDISAQLSELNISANDAINLKVTINGNGNLRLIRNPEITLPPDFEVYDPKSTENIRSNDNGMSGSKTIDYLFQPRYEGDYTIPPIRFVYFDPASQKFVAKTTQEFELHVEKGTDEQSTTVVSSLRKEDVQLIGQDIRFIKQNNVKLRQKDTTFFGSIGFYSVYGGSSLLFLLLFLIYRKKVKENANIALVRNKKANRVAVKRLKEAAGFMKNNKNEEFYDSILKSFWGYLSDKLGIPVADLSKESASAQLLKRSVEQSLIDEFVDIIEQCEFARFSPNSGNEARHEFYKQAESVISRMEKQIKR